MLVVTAVLAVTVAAAVAVARRDARTRGAVIIRLVTMVVAETRTILKVARTYDGAGAVRHISRAFAAASRHFRPCV